MKTTPRRPWHKSTYSANEGECVEVSEGADTGVRDSVHPQAAQLNVPAVEWAALLNAIK